MISYVKMIKSNENYLVFLYFIIVEWLESQPMSMCFYLRGWHVIVEPYVYSLHKEMSVNNKNVHFFGVDCNKGHVNNSNV